MSPPKGMCMFSSDLQKEYPFIEKLFLTQMFGAICVPLVSTLVTGGGF
jgi:hypothetical protein